jgi:molybdate transport system regulatory protein
LSQTTTKASTPPQLVVRIKLGGDGTFGPGKAELLESIDRLGSISTAARAMRMSYRQAWMLLDTMNQAFRGPLVQTSRGGPRGGGATLTHLGKQILVCYRALQRKAAKSTRDDLEAILSLTAVGFRPALRKRPGSQRLRGHGSSS